METFMNRVSGNISKAFRLGKKNIRALAVLSLVLLWSCTTPIDAQRVQVGININLPSWAPYYDNANLVRYYYLPDIECYYDVRNREFIYMDDGEWMFGRTLPRNYAWFDLNNCFIVTLDARVVEPWRHFHYYVAHYPRYYYRTVYRDLYRGNKWHLRGFNENERKVVFNHRSEMEDYSRNRRNYDYRSESNNIRREDINSNREQNIRNDNRQGDDFRRSFPDRRVESTHPAEQVKYYGREVGRPVRVQRNMKRAEETKVNPGKEVKQNRQR